MKILEKIPLGEFTTFRVGGPARYFSAVKNLSELQSAVQFAREKKLSFFVLGKGANVLVSDVGYRGLVIKMKIRGTHIEVAGKGTIRITAGAGEDWDSFVANMVRKNITGFENLSCIPGTVGAAAYGNIGAYGVEVKEFISFVEAFDAETMKIKKFSNKNCEFSYRESFFKTKKGKKYIITKVIFDLKKKGTVKTEYKDVQEHFLKNRITVPTSKELRGAIIAIRKEKLPDVTEVGTAGSFFKNPIISKRKSDALKKQYPEMGFFKTADGKIKVSAGFLIDKVCKKKGYKNGNIGTWAKQALVIVNYGNGTSEEILKFSEEIKRCVKEKTGIELEREVQVI